VESDVVKSTVSKVENGTSHASAAVLDALARRLGVELVDLVITPGESLRHKVIDATRGLGDAALRDLLRLAQGRPSGATPTPPFREVPPPANVPRVPSEIPLLGYDVAAGPFDFTQVDRGARYVRPSTRKKLHPGCFVARVIGHSMEPRIPDGAYALFSNRVDPDPTGQIVLAQYGGHIDADTATGYTVKVFRSVAAPAGATHRWRSAALEPINPTYPSIPIDPERDHDLRIIARLVEVLAPTPAG